MSFQKSIEECRDPLYGFALKLSRNHHTSEDLVQTTMVKALLNEDKFQTGTNLKGWLFTILRNEFLTDMRKGGRVIDDPEGKMAERLVSLPQQQINIEVIEFEKLFGTMSEEQRRCIQLVCIEGYTYEEVGKMFGVPEGTIKSRVSRARSFLKERLSAPEADSISVGVMNQNDNFSHNHR